MVGVTVFPGTGHVKLSPLMFHEYARQYIHCESLFSATVSHSPIPYFLLCRAIELELKARHLDLTSLAKVKRQFGHSLVKSYDALPPAAKNLNSAERGVLQHASSIYDVPRKGFEYVTMWDAVTGMREFPDLATLRCIAVKVVG